MVNVHKAVNVTIDSLSKLWKFYLIIFTRLTKDTSVILQKLSSFYHL